MVCEDGSMERELPSELRLKLVEGSKSQVASRVQVEGESRG